MARLVVINHVSLDGVMQAPGRPDEDQRGGFEHGGWAIPDNDQIMGEALGKWMGGAYSLLLGRRSYDDMLTAWNRMGGPFKDALNNTEKYVASRNPQTRLSWPNSTLLEGDVAGSVTALKQDLSEDLVIMGSGELIASLMTVKAIDVFVLMIHPLLLGVGRRLFSADTYAPLRLVDTRSTTKGVLLATYEPVR
jgi:dihydrofolate reductase